MKDGRKERGRGAGGEEEPGVPGQVDLGRPPLGGVGQHAQWGGDAPEAAPQPAPGGPGTTALGHLLRPSPRPSGLREPLFRFPPPKSRVVPRNLLRPEWRKGEKQRPLGPRRAWRPRSQQLHAEARCAVPGGRRGSVMAPARPTERNFAFAFFHKSENPLRVSFGSWNWGLTA